VREAGGRRQDWCGDADHRRDAPGATAAGAARHRHPPDQRPGAGGAVLQPAQPHRPGGSGALGLEAVSRGAASATLVEDDPIALQVLHGNVEETGLAATVVDADVSRFLEGPVSPYRLVLADPPYATEVDLGTVVPWVEPDGIVVVERATRGADPVAPEGLEPERSRRYGEATLWYFRRS
jgi:hypothetical protein